MERKTPKIKFCHNGLFIIYLHQFGVKFETKFVLVQHLTFNVDQDSKPAKCYEFVTVSICAPKF